LFGFPQSCRQDAASTWLVSRGDQAEGGDTTGTAVGILKILPAALGHGFAVPIGKTPYLAALDYAKMRMTLLLAAMAER
jgi:hypothetical protein